MRKASTLFIINLLSIDIIELNEVLDIIIFLQDLLIEYSKIENNLDNNHETHSEKLFEQDANDEEDFEIPAFLRRQKF